MMVEESGAGAGRVESPVTTSRLLSPSRYADAIATDLAVAPGGPTANG